MPFPTKFIVSGASTVDPTHDKVMQRRPDRQGGSGLQGLPGPAWALTLKSKSVCLLFTILCLSPTLLTLTEGYLRLPFSEENQLRSDQISRSVVSDSLRPHESQHARPPFPSPTPGVHWDSCPSSQWCHPAISSSVVPFSSCPQSLRF